MDDRPSRIARFWRFWAAFSLRHAWPMTLLGTALFFVCLPAAGRLYGDLRTDLRELLPQGAPAAVGLEELEKRIGGLSSLAIVVRTDDLKAGEKFVDALADKLLKLPASLISRVHWRIDAERDFLEKHGALFADMKDLVAARDALKEQVAKANPLLVDLADDSETPPAATPAYEAALGRIKDAFSRLDRYPDGYLAGEDGHTLVMLVAPPGAAVSLDDDKRIFDAVDNAVHELNPKSFHPSLEIGYGGEVRGVIEAQEALVHDLLISSILVLVAVAAALLIYYRTLRAIPLLVMPLFSGVAMTFALSRAVIHYLNPNTAFLGSIIIGNGINAGIILLARYIEERRHGAKYEDALPRSLNATWLATLAASGAAAVSYGSLGFVSFRGFNQFAFMGFFGMLLCWLSTYAFMPALIGLIERYWPFRELRHDRPVVGWVMAPFANLVLRRPAWSAAITVALIIASGLAAVHFAKDPIQYDFTKLGSRSGQNKGAAHWDKHVDAVLQSYQTPTVVLTDSAEKAQAVATAVEQEQKRDGGGGTIESVVTLQRFLPSQQEKKVELLREIFSYLDRKPRAELPAEVRRLRENTLLAPVQLSQVPERLTRAFVEKDGHKGRVVLVYPTLSTDSSNGRAQMTHTHVVRETALKVDPKARIAGQIVLTTDIVEAITNDGAFTALLSFVAVALITALLMRSLKDAAWVVGSLSLGVLWMAGAMTALSQKLNFVNFAVLPITFGIGVDYAVNLYQRYRQSGSVEEALAASGGAVALCSATTIIGYATLVTADNQAIQSFGFTAVIGEITCLSAALFALPAILSLRERRSAPVSSAAQQEA